ncbi:hypothetical protein ASC94_01485 [Massilia sp. Root418]|nr:hypothetical protein ASC94_01485 [Massilia sp. Root418]
MQEVAAVLPLQAGPAIRAQLAFRHGAIGVAERGTHAVRQQVQRRFVHGAAGHGVQRALGCLAVFFQAALEQNDEGGFAAGRRSQQEQQAAPDLRAGSCRLEVGADAGQCLVQAEQLPAEQIAAAVLAAVRIVAGPAPAQHVPDVLVGVARHQGRGPGVPGHDVFNELAEGATPRLCAVAPRVGVQAVQELLMVCHGALLRLAPVSATLRTAG